MKTQSKARSGCRSLPVPRGCGWLAIAALFLLPTTVSAARFPLPQEVAVNDTVYEEVERAVTDSAEEVPEALIYECSKEVSMPTFPGGMNKLTQFIASKLRYPTYCMENGIEGRVVVKFVVTSTGKVAQAKVVNSVDRYLDAEALRVVSLMPRWTPATKNGKPVGVWFQLPILFRLK